MLNGWRCGALLVRPRKSAAQVTAVFVMTSSRMSFATIVRRRLAILFTSTYVRIPRADVCTTFARVVNHVCSLRKPAFSVRLVGSERERSALSAGVLLSVMQTTFVVVGHVIQNGFAAAIDVIVRTLTVSW